MSQEEAIRAAQERDAALAAEAAASEERQRAGSGEAHPAVSSPTAIPPVPNYQPPLPPTKKPDASSPPLDNTPDRTLRAIPASSSPGTHSLAAVGERRETTVLPVVEEAVEGPSTGDRSRNSRVSSLMTAESDGRPLTPAKDGDEKAPGFGNPLLRGHGGSSSSIGASSSRSPPTPPKTGHGYGYGGYNGQVKPDSADSGYGVGGNSHSHSGSRINGSNGSHGGSNGASGLRSLSGSQKSLNNSRPSGQISRDSLDKALPPLPKGMVEGKGKGKPRPPQPLGHHQDVS